MNEHRAAKIPKPTTGAERNEQYGAQLKSPHLRRAWVLAHELELELKRAARASDLRGTGSAIAAEGLHQLRRGIRKADAESAVPTRAAHPRLGPAPAPRPRRLAWWPHVLVHSVIVASPSVDIP